MSLELEMAITRAEQATSEKEVYMYNLYSNSDGGLCGQFSPGGKGCNYYGGVAIDVENPPAEIKAEHATARLNPEWIAAQNLKWIAAGRFAISATEAATVTSARYIIKQFGNRSEVRLVTGGACVAIGSMETCMAWIDRHEYVVDVELTAHGAHLALTRVDADLYFRMVQNIEDWKKPIDRQFHQHLSDDMRRIYSAVIVFFTGSVATFHDTAKGTIVRAAGYYSAVGA